MNVLRFNRKQLCIPYAVFLILFVIAPLIVIVYYAFTNGEGKFSFANFINFFASTNTLGTLMYSFAPMWINFTLRITALKEILSAIEGNISAYPFLNSVIGMTYDFLPFMILPLYTSLLKLDKSLLEAASDLGASKAVVFMSVPGIVSGITMVLLPSMTNYVVLDMLYNSTYIMGSLIGSYFSAYDWHNGSMISLILLVIIFIVTLVTNRFSDKDADERRTVL